MKLWNKLAMGAAVAVTSLAAAQAQELEISGNVALTTNYVFRGITQTDDGPAIQGGFDIGSGGWYAGTWASSVDFGDDTTMEIDFYGGYGGSITETISYDVGVIYYAYPDSPDIGGGSQDFVEYYGSLAKSFGAFELGAGVAYSDDFYGETGESLYYSTSASYALTEELSFEATYGVSDFEEDGGNRDYQDYSIGGSYVTPYGVDVGFAYIGTTNFSDNTDTFVFSVSKSL